MQNLRRPKFEKICGGRIYEGATNRYICEASILKLPTTVSHRSVEKVLSPTPFDNSARRDETVLGP